jgi:hypothetical protein
VHPDLLEPVVVAPVVLPAVVPVTVSVFPTLQPLATKAASSTADIVKERLPSKPAFRCLSHAMRLIPSEILKIQKYDFLFVCSNHLTLIAKVPVTD